MLWNEKKIMSDLREARTSSLCHQRMAKEIEKAS